MATILLDNRLYDNNKNEAKIVLKLMKKSNKQMEKLINYIAKLETQLRYHALENSLTTGTIDNYRYKTYVDIKSLMENIDERTLNKSDSEINSFLKQTKQLENFIKKNNSHIKNLDMIFEELKTIHNMVNKFEQNNKKINIDLELQKMSQKEMFDKSLKSFSYSFDKLREIEKFKIDKTIKKINSNIKNTKDFHTNNDIISKYIGPKVSNTNQREDLFSKIYLSKVGGTTKELKKITSVLDVSKE